MKIFFLLREFFVATFILLFASINIVSAEEYTGTFRGTIIDSQTELPIPGASVILLHSSPFRGVSADIQGRFEMKNMAVGRHDVKVSAMGYQPAILNNLLVRTGKELVLYIRLEEQVYQIEGVEVRPELRKDQPMNEMATVSARSFTIEETERYAGSLGDPSRMAANFAGVSSASDQRNDIIIRGNSPLGLLWRLDGIEIPNPNHFGSMGSTGGPVSVLNNNLLSNSDFYTGAFPAAYGNALAGAFDLNMRYGNNQRREHMAQVGFNGFELGAEGPFSSEKKASYLVNFRYSTMDVLHHLGMSFGTGAAVPQYKDIAFKLNFPTRRGRISVFGIGGDSHIAMLDSKGDSASYGWSGNDLWFGADMGVAAITHVHYFENEARLTSSIAVSGHRNTLDLIDPVISPDIMRIIERDYDIKLSVSSSYSRKFNVKNFMNMGITYDQHKTSYRGKEYLPSWEKYFFYMNSTGFMGFVKAFGEWQHRFSDNLVLNTGIHNTWLTLNNSVAVEPRLGLKWTFLPGQSLNVGYGLHSQSQLGAVYFMEELIDTTMMNYRKTNENVGFSRSMHYVAGYDRLLSEGHRIKLEAYYQRLYHIPVSHQRPEFSILNNGGNFTFFAYHYLKNEGEGENMGVEITLEKFLNKGFYYLFTASVFDSKYKAYDGKWRNTGFNNNYIFNLLGGYEWKLSQRSMLAIDLKGVFAGGNRYIPIHAEASAENNGTIYDWNRAYENRYPDYFRLNARLTFRLNGQKVNQEWGLDLQNITRHENIFTQTWDNSKQEISTSYQMGFMPMMTYKIFF